MKNTNPSFETICNTLLNELIDDRVSMYGIKNTISYFLDFGINRDGLIQLGFDAKLVDEVIAELTADPEIIYDME